MAKDWPLSTTDYTLTTAVPSHYGGGGERERRGMNSTFMQSDNI
jgi:hypothetical protein